MKAIRKRGRKELGTSYETWKSEYWYRSAKGEVEERVWRSWMILGKFLADGWEEEARQRKEGGRS